MCPPAVVSALTVSVVIVSVPIVAVGPALSARSSSPDPKSLVLQLADMPTGFGLKSAQYRSNEMVARENNKPLSKILSWGRINGYKVVYTKPVALSSLLKGPIEIDSTASVYRAARGARASFADSLAGLSKKDPKRKLKQLAVGTGLGEQARLYTYVEKSGGFTIRVFLVAWRTDRFIASVLTGGVDGGIESESAVDLAKGQQARLRRAT